MMDWQTCDGSGRSSTVRTDEAAVGVSRRGLMVGLSMGLLGWMSTRSALAQVSVGRRDPQRNVVVVVFLRGGADGRLRPVRRWDAVARRAGVRRHDDDGVRGRRRT